MKFVTGKSLLSIILLILFGFSFFLNAQQSTIHDYNDLVKLFKQWREFEKPPLLDGAPDYTAKTFSERYESFKKFKMRLGGINYSKWPTEQQVDWYILLAEMNGFDFNHRILKPWVRDPAFYKSIWMEKSDTPAHEGPMHHAVTELWTYSFPLTKNEEERLIAQLKVIAPLNQQAQMNLTGNARELWVMGIRDFKEQSKNLDLLKENVGNNASTELKLVIAEAKASTDQLAKWLEEQGKTKTGPSGIGKDNYTWYQKNVHMVPLTWEDEVMVLKRELARAWSSLKLEEHRNRHLPPLKAAASPEEYNALAQKSANNLVAFLRDQEIVTVEDYFQPIFNDHLLEFYPEEKRNFFIIGAHYDPTPLFSHFYHWLELERMQVDPHPSIIRRDSLLYNIFDSRNEGLSTAVEEMFMQAGLYDDNPRAREIVYILIAQRAARGLGSLYAHANKISVKEASKIHAEWTPRGWTKTDAELLIFEQHLYLRQPGYGTSYIIGKYLIEETMADFAKQKESKGQPFRLKEFMDNLNDIGNIPMSLSRWQMTGLKDQIKGIFKK